MKTSIEKPKENIWKFPCLGIHNSTSKIVAFMDYKKGVIVEEGNGALPLGHYGEDWEMTQFIPYAPTETKPIDWEARRWKMASKIFAETEEITMKTKLKIGDKVLLTKPKENNSDILVWTPDMEVYNGKVLIVKKIDLDDNTCLCEFKDVVVCWFCESWLTKVEEGIITEEPKTEETKTIDWEARRWKMASKIFAETEDITLDSAVRQADIFIEYYKRTSKTINNSKP